MGPNGRLSCGVMAWALCLSLGPSLSAWSQNTPAASAKPTVQVALQLTAQERLDAIRHGLVEASLQTPTQVTSTTWMDNRGGLHEFSSFKNRMQVQGVQVVGFDRDPQGQARAKLQIQPSATSAATSSGALSSSTASPACPASDPQLKHVVRFTLRMSQGTHSVIERLMPPLLQEQWLDASAQAQDQIWRWVPDLARPLIAREASTYERVLLSRLPENMPWDGQLSVSTRTLQAPAPVPWELGVPNAIELSMVLTLSATDRHTAPRNAQARLVLDLDMPQWHRPQLQASSQAQLMATLRQLQNTLHNWLKCEPVRPAVTATLPPRIRINAGALAGVQVGDEWLIADPAAFPSRLVAKDGAPQTLLARVDAVSPHEAMLSVLAGPAQAAQTEWRAWPMQTLVQELAAHQARTTKPKKATP